MIRIAAIGYGDIAQRRHFPEIKQLSGKAQLAAIAGRNIDGMRSSSERFGIPKYFTDVDEMLADDDIDAVLVLTPPGMHAYFAIKAIRAGKHVLVEKPLTMSVKEAQQILAALDEQAKKKPVTFFPLPHVSTPEHKLVRDLLSRNTVGQVASVEAHRGHRGPTHAGWFYDRSQAGGGVLLDLGIYAISTLVHLFGAAQSVTALYDTCFPSRTLDDGTTIEPDVEDIALVSLKLECGLLATVNANWNGSLSHHDTRRHVVVVGREGFIHFGLPDGAVYVYRPDGAYDDVVEPHEPVSFGGYPCRCIHPKQGATASTIVEDFVAAIENEDTSTTNLRKQIHVIEIVLSAYRTGSISRAERLRTVL